MISCLVATKDGKWGVYVATTEQLQKKEQPTYLAPYDQPSQVWKALDALLAEDETDGFTDYGSFWQKVREAGVVPPDPEKLPHRQKAVADE